MEDIDEEDKNNNIFEEKNGKLVFKNPDNEKQIKNFITNHFGAIKFNTKKNVFTYNNGIKSQELANNKIFTNIYNQVKKEHDKKQSGKGNDNHKTDILEERDFENIGKAVAYRSALGLAVNGEDFRGIARDAMEDASEYSISQLENLEDLYEYASSLATLNDIIKRESDNEELNNQLTGYKKDIANHNTRNTIIKDVKDKYSDTYQKYYDKFKQAFDKGLKAQQEAMAKPDFEWKDPITGLEPKGVKGKLTKYAGKGLAHLGELGKSLYNKIPREHNLENDLARLACLGVRAMMFGAKGISKLLGIARNHYSRKAASSKKKETVKTEIDKFVKEYETWSKKYQGKKPKDEDKLKEYEKDENDILLKLNDLFYVEITPYMVYKLQNVIYCFEAKENLFLIKQNEDVWLTCNTESDKLTKIEDYKNLLLDVLENTNNKLGKILVTYKDKDCKKAFSGMPKDFVFNKKYSDDFKKWCDNLEEQNGLANILNIYNENVIRTSDKFNTFDDVSKYLTTAIETLKKATNIKPIVNSSLKFKDEKLIESTIPGIITKKEEKEEEKENNEENVDKETMDKITQDIEELTKVNTIDDFKKAFNDNRQSIDKTYELVKEMNKKLSDEDKKKLANTGLTDKTDTMSKLFFIQLSKSLNKVESVEFDKNLNVILEAEEVKAENTEIETLIKNYNELLKTQITLDNVSDMMKKKEELEKKINELVGKVTNENIKKSLEEYKNDPMAMLYALNSATNKNDKPKEEQEAPKPPNNATQDIDKVAKQLANLGDNINDESIFKMAKNIWDAEAQLDKEIKTWIDKPEYKVYRDWFDQLYNKNEYTKDIKNQVIPSFWIKNKILKFHKDNEHTTTENYWYCRRMLELLNEAEETNTQKTDTQELYKTVKEILDNDIEAMYKKSDPYEFRQLYENWKGKIEELYNKIVALKNDEINKSLDKYKNDDPYALAVACAMAVQKLSKANNGENKENNGQNTEQQGNQENTTEKAPENGENKGNNEQS